MANANNHYLPMLGLLYAVYNTLPVEPHELVEEKICLKETGLPYERTTEESEGEALLPDINGELCGVPDCIYHARVGKSEWFWMTKSKSFEDVRECRCSESRCTAKLSKKMQ
jgi:hypothetical protein